MVNPNPIRIPTAIWQLWTAFKQAVPVALLSGIYADKPGYHNYRDALPSDDYSVDDLIADRRGPAGYASALDLSLPPAEMRRYTTRLDQAARARDPRLYSPAGPVLRGFIGTLNSQTVYCYVLTGGRPLGVATDAGPDPGRSKTHLWHIHLSIIRQFCDNWPALDGVLSVLRGESLAAWRVRTGEDMDFRDGGDGEALIYRVGALVSGSTAVGGGPTRGEPVKANIAIAALELKVATLATRVEALAAAETTRDTELRALVQQMLTLLQEHANGGIDAEAVVRRMGELLSAATP